MTATDAPATADAGWTCPTAPAPPVGAAITGLTLANGWTNPQALAAPVNTAGWEDSSYISPDGTTLYFGYTQYDYSDLSAATPMIVADGPSRPGETGPQFNIFEATIQGGAWQVAASSLNSTEATISEAAESVDETQTLLAYVVYDSTAQYPGDIYLSHKTNGAWGTPELLPAPINTPCIEDNTALSADGKHLYFDSNRLDATGSSCNTSTGATARTIYESTLGPEGWSAPTPVPGAPNEGTFHWQAYSLEPQSFFWAGSDSACGSSVVCLYSAPLLADGGYAPATVFAQPVAEAAAQVGDAYIVGEVSFTCDGHYMYFAYAEKTATGANLNIGVAEKQ